MFINWKGRMYSEFPDLEEGSNTCQNFWKLWEKMHDFNCSKFDYNTEEWKYYFQTTD
jgi:hypothetical protein